MSVVRVKTVPADVLAVKSSGPLGQATAIFSRFNVIDHDGDVTLPGAILDGTQAVCSPYNHSSVNSGTMPAGRATIRADAEKAVAHVEFFMTTQVGREAFETVRELGELGEWSYAFKVRDAELGEFEGRRVQFLKALDVFEVSPVIKGAGVRTMTTDAKEREALEAVRRIRDQQLGLVDVRAIRAQFMGGARGDEARAIAMREQLRFIRNQLIAS